VRAAAQEQDALVPDARRALLAAAVARGLVALPHAAGVLLGPPGGPWSPWAGALLGGRSGRAAAGGALARGEVERPAAGAPAAPAREGGPAAERAPDAPAAVAGVRERAPALQGEAGGARASGAPPCALTYGDAAGLEAWQALLPLELLWPRVAPLLQARPPKPSRAAAVCCRGRRASAAPRVPWTCSYA